MPNEEQNGHFAKPILCDVTLKYLIKDCEERLKILEEQKQTAITLGRINEIKCLIVHLQQFILDNIT